MRSTFKCSETPGTLWHLCQTIYFSRKAGLDAQHTRDQYGYALNRFGCYLGRDPVLSDLDDDVLIGWMKHEAAKAKSLNTVRERVGRVLALWTWCAKRRLVEQFPTVRRPQGVDPVPIALTEEQIRTVFDECLYQSGRICGIRAAHWWQAFLAFVWSTGERRGASLALTWSMIDFPHRTFVIPADVRKGKRKAGVYPVWPEVAALLQRIRKPEREQVFPWDKSEESYYSHLGKIMERAGLPNDRKHKTHCFRVSHATWLQVLGGDPRRALMHADAATTEKHYLDPRLMPTAERKLFVPWTEDDPSAFEFV